MKRKKRAAQRSADESAANTRPGFWHNVDRYQFLAYIIAFAVFGYTCLRSSILSICHDEAFTYLYHARESIQNILLHKVWLGLSSHLLNTLLMKLLCSLFGNSELVIRIPALIGHAIYLIASYKILRLFLEKGKFLIGFLLLTTNPFLLDFFSCARGYALGTGFLMFGLYFFLKRTYAPCDNLRSRYNALSLFMLGLSVLSTLTFAHPVLVIITLIGISETYKVIIAQNDSRIETVKTLAKGFLAPAAFVLVVLRVVYSAPLISSFTGSIDGYGGTTGFWADTVTSVLKYVLYGKNIAGPGVLHLGKTAIFVIYAAILIGALAIAVNKRISNTENTNTLWLAALLLLTAFSMSIQFALSHVLYAIGRRGIYLVPIYLLMVLYFWPSLSSTVHRAARSAINALFFSCISAAVLYGVLCMNITHNYDFCYDADTKNVMGIIYDKTKGNLPEGRKYRIGINWLFEPATNYYIFKNKMFWIDSTTRAGPDGVYDLYYLLDTDKDIVTKYDLQIIRHSDISGATLASHKGL